MTETLRWPTGRNSTFVDRHQSYIPDEQDLKVGPGETVEIDDPHRIEQYLERGFERVTEAEPDVA